MTDRDEVLDGSAVELAARIARKEVSSEEITRAYLDRIDEANPTLQAFVTHGRKRALYAARRRDATMGKQSSLPPFWGVPTGIKDLHFVKEFPTRFGSPAMRMPFVPVDDRLTRRMREAGFVIMGKLATSEVGALPVTEPLHHGPTVTAWGVPLAQRLGPQAHRSAGGSSGGSGSALSGGLVPIAPGSDGAGSIRIPASFNGLVGIKPSRGRVFNAFGKPDQTILYTDGPLAHSVLDAAHLLDVLSGITVGKPSWAPAPSAPFSAALTAKPRRLRVRVSYTHALAATNPEVAAATRKIADLLSSFGHEITESPWLDIELDEFLPVWQFAVAETRILVGNSPVHPSTAWLRERGRAVTEREVEALKALLTERIRRWFGDADLWLSPTVCDVAPPVGLASDANGEVAFRKAAPLGAFTAPYNLTGQPALSLPVGLSSEGLPIGVQLAGCMFDEATLITEAARLEQALGPFPRAARVKA
jgi:amidase